MAAVVVAEAELVVAEEAAVARTSGRRWEFA
jgi:hypothetical protein